MNIAVGMHQHQGKREYQQDSMSIKNFGQLGILAILADGMGGYQGGEIASRIVSENFRDLAIKDDDILKSLKEYLFKGNKAIREYKSLHPEVQGMGTTALAFFMTEKSYQWVSVGDSPLYKIQNGIEIRRINENHSMAGLLDLRVKKGEITAEEAASSPNRHMVTSAVSGDNIAQIDASGPFTIKKGDIFILASDGIETISQDRIKEIVLENMPTISQENAQKACEALIDEVISRDARKQDNVTVMVLAKIDDDEPQTILYEPSPPAKNRKILYLALSVLAALIVALAMYFLIPHGSKTADKTEYPKKDVQTTEAKHPVPRREVMPDADRQPAANSKVQEGKRTEKEDVKEETVEKRQVLPGDENTDKDNQPPTEMKKDSSRKQSAAKQSSEATDQETSEKDE